MITKRCIKCKISWEYLNGEELRKCPKCGTSDIVTEMILDITFDENAPEANYFAGADYFVLEYKNE